MLLSDSSFMEPLMGMILPLRTLFYSKDCCALDINMSAIAQKIEER